MSNGVGWLASVALGAVLWSVAAVASNGHEVWDVATYWTVFLPAAFLISALLGFAFPERTWRWPLAVMLVQMPVMASVSGEIGNLAPLGAILLLILSLPGMLAAYIGGALRRWVAQ